MLLAGITPAGMPLNYTNKGAFKALLVIIGQKG